MSLENISRLAALTGRDRATVVKLLAPLRAVEKGKAKLYESRAALPLIYELGEGLAEQLDLAQERAQLARSQRIKIDIETEVLRGNLIPAEVVERVWADLLGAFRARCLSIPSRAAMQVLACADLTEAETILKELVYEALNELHEYDPDAYRRAAAKGGAHGSAAAEPDGSAMGRSEPAVKRRIKRRARPVEH